jgi:hypothetical protein
MSSLPDGRDDLEPGEAMQRCLQALDPIRPDLPPRFTRPWRSASRLRSWRTRSDLHPDADLRPRLGDRLKDGQTTGIVRSKNASLPSGPGWPSWTLCPLCR